MRLADLPATDLGRWRLQTSEGSYRWRYVSAEEAQQHPQSTAERYFLGLPTVSTILSSPIVVKSEYTSESTCCVRVRQTYQNHDVFMTALTMASHFTNDYNWMKVSGLAIMEAQVSFYPVW